jgi:hypothetical protein
MVYGETGRFPLEIAVKVRMLSYWCKLVTEKCSKLASKMYNVLLEKYHNELDVPWISFIEQVFNETGYSDIFRTQEFTSQVWVKAALRLRLQDQYVQKWDQTVFTSPKATTYRLYKEMWGFEKYLLKLPTTLRIAMCKFRTTNHKLAIERLRWANVPRENRTCHMCNTNQLGDEFHFLLECQELNSNRLMYIPVQHAIRPNVIKFKQLMTSTDRRTVINVAKFIKFGLQKV